MPSPSWLCNNAVDENVSQPPPQESIADEAVRLVTGPRQDDYSHPYDDFSRTAKIWSGILGIDVTPNQVAMCMVGVKLSRECHKPKRDNRTDAVGYLLTLDMVVQVQDERKAWSAKGE